MDENVLDPAKSPDFTLILLYMPLLLDFSIPSFTGYTVHENVSGNVDILKFLISLFIDNIIYENASDRPKPPDFDKIFLLLPDFPVSPLQRRMPYGNVLKFDFKKLKFDLLLARNYFIFFINTSRLFKIRKISQFIFIVLLPSEDGAFYVRRADIRSASSMLGALKRPLELENLRAAIY